MQNEQLIEIFIARMRKNVSPYFQFEEFFQKAEREGYLHCIHLTLQTIFEQEIQFNLTIGEVISPK